MSRREYDETDARIRPSRTTRRRSKDRPEHGNSQTALVVTVDRGRTTCVLESDNGEQTVITAMKARELGPKSVVVGDLVELVGDTTGSEGTLARIVSVNQRKNSLKRTVDDTAKFERTIVSNIDQLLIVVAAANPEPRRGLIDRFLVSAFIEKIEPIIVVTKVDVAPIPDFIESYKALGVTILSTSSKQSGRAEELAKISEILRDKTSVLVGHSGVGKSTLINDLVPDADRMTGDVNDVTGRGRHTSSSAVALALHDSYGDNVGWIIDTPGIRAFGLSHLEPAKILQAFPDLAQVCEGCMPNCSHYEQSCALNGWSAGNLERETRVSSLRSLLEVKNSSIEGDESDSAR